MSVGVTTSKNLSEAFSLSLRTWVAVSYRAIPFSVQNRIIFSLSNLFSPLISKWLLSLKKMCPIILHI